MFNGDLAWCFLTAFFSVFVATSANAVPVELRYQSGPFQYIDGADETYFGGGGVGNTLAASFTVDLPSRKNAEYIFDFFDKPPYYHSTGDITQIGGSLISGQIDGMDILRARIGSSLAFKTDASGNLTDIFATYTGDTPDIFIGGFLGMGALTYGGAMNPIFEANGEWTLSAVPLPMTAPLLLIGIGGLTTLRRRDRV